MGKSNILLANSTILKVYHFKRFNNVLLNSDSLKEIVQILVFIFLICPISVNSSLGDRDSTFNLCLRNCKNNNCSGSTYSGNQSSPLNLHYLNWGCDGECKYFCMWKTVEYFNENGLQIPQFFGKWPFTRILGFQEPASVFFSVGNLISHIFGIHELRKKVQNDSPLFSFWIFSGLVCINGWVWSIAFHSRDTAFTEIMDYLGAFAMIVFSFLAAFVRYFEKFICLPVLTISSVLLALFFQHAYYLAFVRFDYGYNMKANIAIGVLNASCWLAWCYMNKNTHPHVVKCALFVTLAVLSILLEVLDFPPIFWLFDSHSLWHLFTAPITFIWYSFLIDDCNFLREQQEKSLKKKI